MRNTKTKPFWLFLCILLTFQVSANAVFGATAPVLNLRQAVQFAIENSPNFDSAAKLESIGDLQYKSAVAKILPSLDFTTTDGLQNNIPISSANSSNAIFTSNPTAPWYSSLNLGITENLYDNGVSLTNISIANLNRDLARINFQKTRAELTLSVADEFYRFSLFTVLLSVRKEQQAILDKQFHTLSSQYVQGFKTRSDFLRLKAQVQRAEIDRVAAENNIVQSEANLRKILGVSFSDTDPPAFSPVPVDRDSEEGSLLPTQAPSIDHVYEFRIQQIQEEINGKNVTLARRNYLPQVSLTSGVNYSNQDYIHSPTPYSAGNQLSWNALVTLQYNLWDWGSRKRDVQIADYNRDINNNDLRRNVLDVNAQVVELMASIAQLSKSFPLTRELLSLEEESERQLETQYREGKVTYLDLVTELNNLLDAKVQFFTSYFEVLTDQAQYNYFNGNLYETIIEK